MYSFCDLLFSLTTWFWLYPYWCMSCIYFHHHHSILLYEYTIPWYNKQMYHLYICSLLIDISVIASFGLLRTLLMFLSRTHLICVSTYFFRLYFKENQRCFIYFILHICSWEINCQSSNYVSFMLPIFSLCSSKPFFLALFSCNFAPILVLISFYLHSRNLLNSWSWEKLRIVILIISSKKFRERKPNKIIWRQAKEEITIDISRMNLSQNK